MILKNENDFEKLKWIWKTKMISKNENEFEKWKWTWKMKMNLNIHTISGVRYDTTLLYPQLSPDAIATPRQPTSHWWLCRWFQPARPSAILSALAGRCWPPLPPQRPPLKSLSTAGRVFYTKIDYTIQREKFHVPIRLLLFEAGHEKKAFLLKRTWATWPFGSSSLASTAMSAASMMVEKIDVAPIFGVQSVAAAETEPSFQWALPWKWPNCI